MYSDRKYPSFQVFLKSLQKCIVQISSQLDLIANHTLKFSKGEVFEVASFTYILHILFKSLQKGIVKFPAPLSVVFSDIFISLKNIVTVKISFILHSFQ